MAGAATTNMLTRAGSCTGWDATDACCQPGKNGRNGGDGPYVTAVVQQAPTIMNDAHNTYNTYY